MAGPLPVIVGTRATNAGAATLTPSKPTVGNTGGILVALLATKNNATHATATSGWTLIAQVNSGASFTASIWKALEAAVAPVFTWTGSVACAAQITYLNAPDGNVDLTVGSSTSNTGSGATHSTTSINSSRDNSDVLYIDAAAANTAMATPSGWTENADGGSATDAGRFVWGNKQIATSGSASGAISVTGAAADWVQWQVEIQLAQATALDSSKAEVAAWIDLTDDLISPKVEVAAWLDVQSPFETSKIEVAAWLDYDSSSSRRRQIIT